MNPIDRRMLTLLAMLGAGSVELVPRVVRCDPSIDEASAATVTAVCRRCKRRLTMADFDNLPRCEGKP